MASVNEGLLQAASEYNTTGQAMLDSVAEMDDAVALITSGQVVYGEQAPQDVSTMWDGGVREAMESYGKKLQEVATLLEAVYNSNSKVDGSSDIASDVTVTA